MTRGEIYMMDFGIPIGSEPGYRRPVIIIQAEKENLKTLNTSIVIPVTSNLLHSEYRGSVFIPKKNSGLSKDSVALVFQILVVDKIRLFDKVGKVDYSIISKIENELDYVLKDQ